MTRYATPTPTVGRDAWRPVADTAPGWLHDADGPALYEAATLAIREHGGPIVEVGSYAGKSSCWLGAAARDSGSWLVCVDPFRGSPEMAPGRECHDPAMMSAAGDFDSLPAFRDTIRRAGLEQYVVPIATTSEQAAEVVDGPFSLVFVDGDHGDQDDSEWPGPLADYWAWNGMLRPGGLLIFHDSTVPAVGEAVRQALHDGYTAQPSPHAMAILRAPR